MNIVFFLLFKGIPFKEQGGYIMYAKQEYLSETSLNPRVRYDKGHLVPRMTYSGTEEHLLSTYTYTNAVPQHHSFNGGAWSTYERTIRNDASKICIEKGGELYLLTGTAFVHVQPGNPKKVNHPAMKTLGAYDTGIFIPHSLWTAGCCVAPDERAFSFAIIGNNEHDPNLMQVTLNRLQIILSADVGPHPGLTTGGPDVDLFPGNPNCVAYNLHLDKKKLLYW